MILLRWIDTRPRWLIATLCLFLIGAVGLLDYATGLRYSVAILYPLPIIAATWKYGRIPGYGVAGLCSMIWLAIDAALGRQFNHISVPIWNTTVQLGFFLVFVTVYSSLKNALVQEEYLARHDPLTGAVNGRFFRELVNKQLRLAKSTQEKTTLAYLDVDNFKHINETYGHAIGDHILCTIVGVMTSTLRREDQIGRLGGDEFCLLLPRISEREASIILHRIQAALHTSIPSYAMPLSVSIGAVVIGPPLSSIDELIGRADQLMFTIKHHGKNGIAIESLSQSGQ